MPNQAQQALKLTCILINSAREDSSSAKNQDKKHNTFDTWVWCWVCWLFICGIDVQQKLHSYTFLEIIFT